MLCLLLFFTLSKSLYAEIGSFEENENKGLNKAERIGLMEKFLVSLPQEIKSLEAKIDENNKTIKALEASVKSMKDDSAKMNLEKAEVKEPSRSSGLSEKEAAEFKKLKEDFLALKNKDVEFVSSRLESFTIRLENIEKILKISPR